MNLPVATVQLRHLTPDGRPATPADAAIDQAVARTVGADTAAFDSLPFPVRFRASGAIKTWAAARQAAGASGRHFSGLLSDPQQPPVLLLNDLGDFVQQHSTLNFDTSVGHAIASLCSQSVYWQAFWERDGALFEPTSALNRLLDATDIADNIPIRLVQPPMPAMCIVPDAATRSRLGGVEAIGVFTHANDPLSQKSDEPTERCISFVAISRVTSPQPGTQLDLMMLSVDAEDLPIGQSLEIAINQPPLFGEVGQPQARLSAWRATLNYVVKMMLYLSLDNRQITHERPYSTAPRMFPGLGKRKRDEQLALVETLYDRYVVGPAVLSADLAASSDGDSPHGVSAHWRRGHFRFQPHGPHNSLRKLMFIAPTLVHASQFLDTRS